MGGSRAAAGTREPGAGGEDVAVFTAE